MLKRPFCDTREEDAETHLDHWDNYSVGARHRYEFFGTICTVEILTDSSAGKTIALRKSCGKVRHLDTKQLYIQDVTASGRLRVLKCRGGDNLADMGTKPLARSYIERYTSMMGIAPRTTQVDEVDVASFAVGSKLKSAVAVLVSALLMQPSTGSVVELTTRDGTAHEVQAEKFDWKFVAVVLALVCMLVGAGAYLCSRCVVRSSVGLSSPLVATVAATPSSAVRRPVAKPTVSMATLAACIDSGHEVRCGRNQFSVYVSCKRCKHHAAWLFRQSNVSFRRHPPMAALVGDSWDKGRATFLAQFG